jgi:hypothetical protein
MLMTFLVVSGWIFWAIIAALVFIEIALLTADCEKDAAPTFIAMAALAGVILFTDALEGMRPAWIVLLVSGYVAAGIIWSIKKWYSFSVDSRDELKTRYETSVNKTMPGNETWAVYSQRQRPTAAENKQRIISWMVLWPFSLTWWMMTWPRRAFSWLYDRLSTLFDRISDRVFAS